VSALRQDIGVLESLARRYRDLNFDKFLPLFSKIDKLRQEGIQPYQAILIAIDGNCAAGKSTLAARLKTLYDCNVFSMDDFFLKQTDKTEKRLNEPGGNVDHERFLLEVIKPLVKGLPLEYRPFDCKTQKLSEPIFATPAPINVIEGVYCLHPKLADVYDIKVFLSLEEKEQGRRLMARTAAMYDKYIKEWIPLDNKYVEAFDIQATCGFVFDC
jgi:uridine kinase